ncbi:type II toxin-antitoxin system RelE/ParE family toxin [Azospirillum endophyticum]
MIRTIQNKALRRFFETGKADKLPIQGAANIARLGRILLALDAAGKPEDLNLPGFYFHGLEGAPPRWSVRVTANWRVTFAWDAPDAIAVDLEDYH